MNIKLIQTIPSRLCLYHLEWYRMVFSQLHNVFEDQYPMHDKWFDEPGQSQLATKRLRYGYGWTIQPTAHASGRSTMPPQP